jgi:hypothetical protein
MSRGRGRKAPLGLRGQGEGDHGVIARSASDEAIPFGQFSSTLHENRTVM